MSAEGMKALGLAAVRPVPDRAVAAAAAWLHEKYCENGSNKTCSLWLSNPKHAGYYHRQAERLLADVTPYLTASQG